MKSIFASKTFWLNLLGVAGTVTGILPPKYATIALPIVNIGLRMVTSQGTYVVPPIDESK